MQKFISNCFPLIGLVDYSKPFAIGKLNKQYIALLSASGVPDEVFIRKQSEHFELLSSMFSSVDAALDMLLFEGYYDLVINHKSFPQLDLTEPTIVSALYAIYNRYLNKKEPNKIRILIRHSRTLYGVADHTKTLKYGEVFCRITTRGESRTIKGLVIVSKNPCYLLGDIRVLKAVDSSDYPALRHLERDCVDCVVFPVQGVRPHSVEIAGSDYDGDQYLIRSSIHPPPPDTSLNSTLLYFTFLDMTFLSILYVVVGILI